MTRMPLTAVVGMTAVRHGACGLRAMDGMKDKNKSKKEDNRRRISARNRTADGGGRLEGHLEGGVVANKICR